MNGKQLATIFLVLAIFGIAQAAIIKTELLTASLAGAAHQGEALHAIAGDMACCLFSCTYGWARMAVCSERNGHLGSGHYEYL